MWVYVSLWWLLLGVLLISFIPLLYALCCLGGYNPLWGKDYH